MILELKDMSMEEKFRTMEMLWDDICRNVPDFPSPDWHENILKEREQMLIEGKDHFEDWQQAKQDLWKLIS